MFRGPFCGKESDAMERPEDSIHMYNWMYVDNSKMVGERGRSVVKEFVGRRKNPMQVYWS